ncbi:putative solute-binding protein, partial [Acinetobacter baumannii]
QKDGVKFSLKSYTDERVATQDLIAGQCDAVFATGLRTRQFNAVSGAMDAFGAASVGRNGHIDINASYDVVRRTIQTFSSPAAGSLM